MNERKYVVLLHKGTIETIEIWSSKKKMCDHYPEFSYSYLRKKNIFNQIEYKGYFIHKVLFN